ncbi:MAG TPA: hypothetical protein VM327_03710 [Candidatus Thermoplasmatota archaeon]|nr:hypothetical protein [Candidatus Thermoplasmatota archaeon]
MPTTSATDVGNACVTGYAGCYCVEALSSTGCEDKWGAGCSVAIGLDGRKEPVACGSGGSPPDSGTCVIGYLACFCAPVLTNGPCTDKWGNSCTAAAGLDADRAPLLCGADGDPPADRGTCVIGYLACFCLAALGDCYDYRGAKCEAAAGLDAEKTPLLC